MYNGILTTYTDNLEALINSGSAYYRLGEYVKAIPDFEKALDIEPNNFALVYRAFIPYKLGRLEEARILQ